MAFAKDYPIIFALIIIILVVFVLFIFKQLYENKMNKMLEVKQYDLRVFKPKQKQLFTNYRVLTTATIVPVLVIVFILSYGPKNSFEDNISINDSSAIKEIIMEFNEDFVRESVSDLQSDSEEIEPSSPTESPSYDMSDDMVDFEGTLEITGLENKSDLNLEFIGSLVEYYYTNNEYYVITEFDGDTFVTIYDSEGSQMEGGIYKFKGDVHSTVVAEDTIYVSTYIMLPDVLLDDYNTYLPEFDATESYIFQYNEITYFNGVEPEVFLTVYRLDTTSKTVQGSVLLAPISTTIEYTKYQTILTVTIYDDTPYNKEIVINYNEEEVSIDLR